MKKGILNDVSDSNTEIVSPSDKLERKIAEVAQGVKKSKFQNYE